MAEGNAKHANYHDPCDLASDVSERADAEGDLATFRYESGARAWRARPGHGSVVELGCGLGLAGIVAAAAPPRGGAVLLTDGDARVAARAGENARANAGPGVAAVEVAEHRFGDVAGARRSAPRARGAGGFDRVLAADVLYESGDAAADPAAAPRHWQVRPFFESARAFLRPAGTLDLAFSRRLVPLDDVEAEAKACGFSPSATVDGTMFDMPGNDIDGCGRGSTRKYA
ncbi:hypothetical protein SO694_00053146 [Aureococcus anophagefferens]|uniref:Methyltransferase n=1 Tax=Aureococcus anophagefferens TaxID=44056 RepID=A0ABR1FY17_AURAN